MFGKLFKKNTEELICSPVDGKLCPIDEVPDDVFSKKVLGDGFEVKPSNGNISSPIYGKITTIFPTKHAIGMVTDSGIEVLVHMGIDTVELKGIPFQLKISNGNKVKKGAALATVDLDYLKERNIHNDMIVVFSNMDKIDNINIEKFGNTSAGDVIGTVKAK